MPVVVLRMEEERLSEVAVADETPCGRALSIVASAPASLRGSRALLPETWIEEVAQPVAKEVGAQHDERDGHARHGRQPPGVGEIVASFGEHRAPRGLRWLDAQAEEGQTRLEQDHRRELARPDDEDRRERVGEDR